MTYFSVVWAHSDYYILSHKYQPHMLSKARQSNINRAESHRELWDLRMCSK